LQQSGYLKRNAEDFPFECAGQCSVQAEISCAFTRNIRGWQFAYRDFLRYGLSRKTKGKFLTRRREMMQRTALLSVYHKEGIVDFASALVGLGWNLLASGGTAKAITKAGLDVVDVADLVGEPILGHKVVTLSREIHAALLADDTPPESAELNRIGVSRIDLVCVDLYPLEDELRNPEMTPESVREKTDIGGPAMLRSAAKGRRIVISDPDDRARVIQWLRAGEPGRDLFLLRLAAKAEQRVAEYVRASADHLNGILLTMTSCG
jgi:phosphoribosylaminoimidazolecarboxamide formyltransferase/IMP cyclohydrolase